MLFWHWTTCSLKSLNMTNSLQRGQTIPLFGSSFDDKPLAFLWTFWRCCLRAKLVAKILIHSEHFICLPNAASTHWCRLKTSWIVSWSASSGLSISSSSVGASPFSAVPSQMMSKFDEIWRRMASWPADGGSPMAVWSPGASGWTLKMSYESLIMFLHS